MTQPAKNLVNSQATTQISNLQRTWDRGEFVFTLQLPPLLAASSLLEHLKTHSAPFTAMFAADAPGGAIGLSSLAIAILLKRAGFEPIVHISGRDRNRLALQSDILGQAALGIPNLLIDVQPITRSTFLQNADARLVTDLDGSELLATAAMMRDEARFTSGATIKTPPELYIGAFGDLATLIQLAQVEALNNAQFLVISPAHDLLVFFDELAAFQAAHSTYLQGRPLIVSLPFAAIASREHQVNPVDAGIQHIISIIAALKEQGGIRGINIVLSTQADLPLLEQVNLPDFK